MCRVTINKTYDMDHNTETLKRLSNTEKPNNQVKKANMGAAALPPGHIKCNILKGKPWMRVFLTFYKDNNYCKIVVLFLTFSLLSLYLSMSNYLYV